MCVRHLVAIELPNGLGEGSQLIPVGTEGSDEEDVRLSLTESAEEFCLADSAPAVEDEELGPVRAVTLIQVVQFALTVDRHWLSPVTY